MAIPSSFSSTSAVAEEGAAVMEEAGAERVTTDEVTEDPTLLTDEEGRESVLEKVNAKIDEEGAGEVDEEIAEEADEGVDEEDAA